jgi:hypothetical protein
MAIYKGNKQGSIINFIAYMIMSYYIVNTLNNSHLVFEIFVILKKNLTISLINSFFCFHRYGLDFETELKMLQVCDDSIETRTLMLFRCSTIWAARIQSTLYQTTAALIRLYSRVELLNLKPI